MSQRYSLCVARAPLRWTSTKPDKPGWYWWRWNEMGEAHITLVNHDWQAVQNKHVPANAYYLDGKGEWAGPIEPPGESNQKEEVKMENGGTERDMRDEEDEE